MDPKVEKKLIFDIIRLNCVVANICTILAYKGNINEPTSYNPNSITIHSQTKYLIYVLGKYFFKIHKLVY